MPLVLSSGCSFIWGSELSDCYHCGTNGYSQQTWPALLATNSGNEYHCVAEPGGGNDNIARNIVVFCETKKAPDLVVVQWTFPWRFGFRFEYPTKSNMDQWYTVDLWSADNEYKPVDKHVTEDDQLFGYSEKMREIAKTIGVKEFANVFFKHVAYGEYWPIYTSLKEIVGLQNYLKVKNIPYLFACADNTLFECSVSTNPDPYIKSLLSQIDFDHWYMFPAGDKPHLTQTPRGFYQWSEENKYLRAPGGHPLEQAHQDAATLIKEKFNEVVEKHLEQTRSRNPLS